MGTLVSRGIGLQDFAFMAGHGPDMIAEPIDADSRFGTWRSDNG